MAYKKTQKNKNTIQNKYSCLIKIQNVQIHKNNTKNKEYMAIKHFQKQNHKVTFIKATNQIRNKKSNAKNAFALTHKNKQSYKCIHSSLL